MGSRAMFGKSTAGCGLRDDDVADAPAAHWLAARAMVNDAKDFTPAAAQAVRNQVAAKVHAMAQNGRNSARD